MPKINIKHIGPITDTGEIVVTPVTLIIGKQSTGKSTFMKILCFCCWMEKRIMLEGEEQLRKYTHYNRFLKELRSFHRFDEVYFDDNSEIHYDGDCVKIDLMGISKNAKIIRKSNFKVDRYNTKISYIPSDRNLASTIQNIDKAYKSSDFDSIFNYFWEFDEAKKNYTVDRPIGMPFDDQMEYYYDKDTGTDKIRLKNVDKTLSLAYASSGVQSALPVRVMVDYFTNQIGESPKYSKNDINNLIAKIILDRNGSKSDKDLFTVDLRPISNMIKYKSAQLYLEELEENLFPESQFEMVKSIMASIRSASERGKSDSYVVMTTHSPYVLTSINMMIKAARAYVVDKEKTTNVVPADVILQEKDFSAFLMDNGGMTDIIDHEYGFICGDFLDGVSDFLSDKTSALDNIIYNEN